MGVNTNQHGFAVLDVTADKGYMNLAIEVTLVGDGAKLAVRRLDRAFPNAPQKPLAIEAIPNQFGDGEHFETVKGAKFSQLRHSRHRAIVVHDFADYAGGDQASQARQIDGSFRLPRPHQHAAFSGAQRGNVAWTGEVGSRRARVYRNLDCASP